MKPVFFKLIIAIIAVTRTLCFSQPGKVNELLLLEGKHQELDKRYKDLEMKYDRLSLEHGKISNELKAKKDSLTTYVTKEKEKNDNGFKYHIAISTFYDFMGRNFTYTLRGDSNPIESYDRVFGLVFSNVIGYKYKKSNYFLSAPISTINLKDGFTVNEVSSFAIGYSYQIKQSRINIGAMISFSGAKRLKKEYFDREPGLFPISLYPTLEVNKQIPEGVLGQYLGIRPKVIPSFTITMSLSEFKSIN